ncbi:unnamed protein product [Penicillium olsonii]|nr:unnamed protein product [Penicillium olsonii]
MAERTQPPATACAELISLNYFFHQVPVPVARNTFDNSSLQQDSILPFSEERRLTEVLAFLAKTTDGWTHIPAVCLQQDPLGTSMTVIIAINKKSYHDGDVILQRLKNNFEEVFRVIQSLNHGRCQQNCMEGSKLTISDTDDDEAPRKIFSSIIKMCSLRILCRLRLKRGKDKKSIQTLLKEAIFGIQRIDSEKLASRDLSIASSTFTTEAKSVMQLVDRWTNHQTPDKLGDLVEGIHHFKQTTPRFHTLLDLISNQHMDPSSRSSLLNIIRKVSRYWTAARQLHRAAKKYPLVRDMKVQPACLPEQAFEGQTASSDKFNLDSGLYRLGIAKKQQNDVSRLCQNLRINESAARARYEEAKKALSAPKIHAEIQIIAFCEMQAPKLFPRTVSSSKDACFLCNSFIQLYGRIHTPRGHGRLYPGWRLPNLPQLEMLQQRLNKKLLEGLQKTVSFGLAHGKLSIHPCPNESNILTSSNSGTATSVPERMSESSVGASSSDDSSVTLSGDPPEYGSLSPVNPANEQSLSCSSIRTVYLSEGEATKHFVKYNQPICFEVAGSLRVYFSFQETAQTKTDCIGCDVERFTAASIESLSRNCPLVDVRQLEGEVTLPLSGDNAFCLVSGDVALKINTNR